MRNGISLAITQTRFSGGSAPAPTPTPSAPISAVAADGWTGTYSGALPTTALGDAIEQNMTVTRQGYDSSAAAGTFPETIRVATPKRQAGTLLHETGKVALSSYIMAADAATGMTNSSTLVSPQPIANFVTPDRLTVTNSVGGADCPVEVFADHWSGVAAVKFLIAKGGATISVTVASPTISTAGSNLDGLVQWDRTPLPVYALPATDISTLTGDGMVTVDCEVYPRVGVSASVNKTVTNTSGGGARREFTTRYFDKRARGYCYAYVDGSTGVDATGVWYASPTSSPANPFLTLKGAMDAIDDAGQLAVTSGVVDGCRIRLRNTATYATSSAASLVQNVGAIIIERDPDTTATNSDVTINFANAVFRPGLASGFTSPLTRGWIVFREVTLSRTGAVGTIAGQSTPVFLTTVLDNCRLDFGAGFGGNTYFAATGGINFHAHYGTQFLNFAGGGMGYNAGNQTQMLRGVNLATASNLQAELSITVTSKLTGAITTFNTTDNTKPMIFYGNEVRSSGGAVLIDPSAVDGGTLGGIVIAGNVLEITSATASAAMLGIGQLNGSSSHSLIYNNSGTGWGGTGRWNLAYDRFSGGDATTQQKQGHPFMLLQGNILTQFNTKGDKWKLGRAVATPEIYDGNLALDHGVLCEGNVMVFNSDAAGSSGSTAGRTWQGTENQTYPGRNTFRNAIANGHYLQDSSVEWTDIYTTYEGTKDNGSGTRQAGLGGGNFALAVASSAKSRLPAPRLTKDFANVTRSTPDSAGAYA